MNTAVPGKPGFLVECAGTTAAAGAPVHVLVTFAVPADEVAFAVFDADSPRAVAELCNRAGIPALRLTPALGAQFPSSG
jgi:hypothetical protein